MLRVNVGLSRKLSKDYNSTGYSINFDGEITAPPSDPEAVMEQVKELFDLAEEALVLQMDRANSEAAIASRDEHPTCQAGYAPNPAPKGNGNGATPPRPTAGGNGDHRHQPGQEEAPATNKQINYLLNIGKRQKLSPAQLERRIGEILGRSVGLYDLTKQAAAFVIDRLTNAAGNGHATSRY